MQSDYEQEIFKAIRNKDLPHVKKLITEEGYDPNITQETVNISALMWSSMYGTLEITKFLHDQGADINALNIFNSSALHLAAMYSKSDQVDYLIHQGASLETVEAFYGNTPLHTAIQAYSNSKIAQENKADFYSTVAMLLIHGADSEAVNNAGQKAVDLAFATQDGDLLNIIHENIPTAFATFDNAGNILNYYSKEEICPAGDLLDKNVDAI